MPARVARRAWVARADDSCVGDLAVISASFRGHAYNVPLHGGLSVCESVLPRARPAHPVGRGPMNEYDKLHAAVSLQ